MSPSHHNSRSYKKSEELDMWKFLLRKLRHGETMEVRGNHIWSEYRADRKSARSVSSLNTHFRKHMFSSELVFDSKLSPKDALYVLKQLQMQIDPNRLDEFEQYYKCSINLRDRDCTIRAYKFLNTAGAPRHRHAERSRSNSPDRSVSAPSSSRVRFHSPTDDVSPYEEEDEDEGRPNPNSFNLTTEYEAVVERRGIRTGPSLNDLMARGLVKKWSPKSPVKEGRQRQKQGQSRFAAKSTVDGRVQNEEKERVNRRRQGNTDEDLDSVELVVSEFSDDNIAERVHRSRETEKRQRQGESEGGEESGEDDERMEPEVSPSTSTPIRHRGRSQAVNNSNLRVSTSARRLRNSARFSAVSLTDISPIRTNAASSSTTPRRGRSVGEGDRHTNERVRRGKIGQRKETTQRDEREQTEEGENEEQGTLFRRSPRIRQMEDSKKRGTRSNGQRNRDDGESPVTSPIQKRRRSNIDSSTERMESVERGRQGNSGGRRESRERVDSQTRRGGSTHPSPMKSILKSPVRVKKEVVSPRTPTRSASVRRVGGSRSRSPTSRSPPQSRHASTGVSPGRRVKQEPRTPPATVSSPRKKRGESSERRRTQTVREPSLPWNSAAVRENNIVKIASVVGRDLGVLLEGQCFKGAGQIVYRSRLSALLSTLYDSPRFSNLSTSFVSRPSQFDLAVDLRPPFANQQKAWHNSYSHQVRLKKVAREWETAFHDEEILDRYRKEILLEVQVAEQKAFSWASSEAEYLRLLRKYFGTITEDYRQNAAR